ncbi:CueP family metal-binding protein [Curtobacterium sp. KT1]|uniref:CueP family metal-binding protein n=1 Tax=Curtobacterium sp. KT1 TaxID=3372858 RepID=UPI0037BF50DD
MLTISIARTTILTATGIVLAAAMLLTGCSTGPAPSPEPPAQGSALEMDEVAGLDAETIIDRLDHTPIGERPTDFTASIRPDTLVLTDTTGTETSVPMPEDRAYVALAPYQQQTHDCYYHAPTNCIGELRNTDIHVTITDTETGKAYYDEDTRTFDNGFVGFWLPKGITATVTVTKGEQTAIGEVSTVANDDATCITTLKFA